MNPARPQARTVELLRRISEALPSASALAERAGVHQSTVSRHLARQRQITPEQLICYLGAVPTTQRAPILAAWLRDTLPEELAESLIDNRSGRVAEDVATYRPEPADDTMDAAAWLIDEMAIDSDLARAFQTFARRMGWTGGTTR